MNTTNLAQWFIGGLVVLIYAYNRFESPLSMRPTTTFVRYWVALCCYIGSMLMLFVLLGGAFSDSSGPLALLTYGSTVPKGAEKLAGPLYSALILTALLPHFPVLKNIDEWVKQEFQRIGNIPFEVRQLSARLQQEQLSVDFRHYPRLREQLHDKGVDAAWSSQKPDTPRVLWGRIATLRLIVGTWSQLDGYVRYLDEHREMLAAIDEQYDALELALKDTRMLTELGRKSPDAPAASHVRQVRRDLAALNKDLCDFVAGGVLQCEWSRADRTGRLKEMGFVNVEDLPRPLGANEIAIVAGLVLLVVNGVAFTYSLYAELESQTGADLKATFKLSVMLSLIYAAAVVIALYPKAIWRFADIRRTTARPFAAYVVSGLVAVACGFLISVTFRYLLVPLDEFNEPGHFYNVIHKTEWPWFIMTMGITMAIACVTDDWALEPGKEPGWLRWAEAVGLAAFFSALQWYVAYMLGRTDSLFRFLLTSAILGAAIGFFVPHRYREGNAVGATPRADSPMLEAGAAAAHAAGGRRR
jgi:hypothetical protein